MRSLKQAIGGYLALRRSLGFKLREYGQCLDEFASFLRKNGSSHVTTKLAVEYATQRQDEEPVSWSRRLGIIRGFARYRMGADPRTEIPPVGLLRFRSRRARPYLYSRHEIRRLLEAALKIESPYELQPHTYHCLFGLLAVSGLRVGEAINLQPQDVDWWSSHHPGSEVRQDAPGSPASDNAGGPGQLCETSRQNLLGASPPDLLCHEPRHETGENESEPNLPRTVAADRHSQTGRASWSSVA